MSLYIDLSEFLAVQMKTGIQRISGEICKHVSQGALVPVRLDGNRFVALSLELIQAIGSYFSDSSQSALRDINRLGGPERGKPLHLSGQDTVLVPEIFGEPRAIFYRNLPDADFARCRFIVYDLLPLTHPQFFPPDMSSVLGGYYHVVRRAGNCGFISDYTRDMYYGRLRRSGGRGGVVLPLGSDALGARTTQPKLNRPLTFSVLGTIEPRKIHPLILEAFEPLLGRIPDLSLSFIGKMGWVDKNFSRRAQALASDPGSGLRFYSAPDDISIRQHIEQSRATIYVSAAEGYGLPPVESLWAGTPVIASAMIPSLTNLGTRGIHIVEPLTPINLRRAVLAFTDDGYANEKITETGAVSLPTWASFTKEVLDWCSV